MTVKRKTRKDKPIKIDYISSGIPPLDMILGGGFAIGRYSHIHGAKSTGKSLLAYHAAYQVQNMGGTFVYIDSEAAWSDIAKCVGVNEDDMLYYTPSDSTPIQLSFTVQTIFSYIEEVLMEKVKSGDDTPILVVWDSIAASTTDEEATKGFGERTIASSARNISKGLRKLTALISRAQAHIMFINQHRTKIGGNQIFGDGMEPTSGVAIDYYASQSVELKRPRVDYQKVHKARVPIGVTTNAWIAKNKVGIPFGECTLPILWNRGVDIPKSCFLWLKDWGFVTVKGGWHYITIGDDEISFREAEWEEKVYHLHEGEVLRLVHSCTVSAVMEGKIS